VDRVAAEIAKEIGMLFKHDDVDPGAREQKAQHHPGRTAAGDATGGLRWGGLCHWRYFLSISARDKPHAGPVYLTTPTQYCRQAVMLTPFFPVQIQRLLGAAILCAGVIAGSVGFTTPAQAQYYPYPYYAPYYASYCNPYYPYACGAGYGYPYYYGWRGGWGHGWHRGGYGKGWHGGGRHGGGHHRH